MDFIDRLKDSVNILSLPLKMRTGYLGTSETLVVYPMPGSKVTQLYMDGTKDIDLNYEIAMKSEDGQKISDTLWLIQNYLENLLEIESDDNSFEFNGLEITNKPFISDADTKGWFVFLLDIKANVTIYNKN